MNKMRIIPGINSKNLLTLKNGEMNLLFYGKSKWKNLLQKKIQAGRFLFSKKQITRQITHAV